MFSGFVLMKELKKHVLFTGAADVRDFCRPLAHLSIDGFIFMRRFADGRFVDLSNQLAWSEEFLVRYLEGQIDFDCAADHMLIQPGVSLWSHNPDNIIWQEGRRDWGFHSGISIAKEGPYWTDIFCFYSRERPETMDKQYLASFLQLEKFSFRFLENCHDLVSAGESKPLQTPETYLTPPQQETPSVFPEEALIEPLTGRERECIYYAVKGNTAQQVAVLLHLSRRTVESHLQNAKDKLGVGRLSEVVRLYPEW